MKLPIYCIQTDIVWENKLANFTRVCALVAEASPTAGGLIVLPEMFATGFSMNTAATAENGDGEVAAFVRVLAQETQCAVIAGLVLRNAAGQLTNSAICYSPEGSLLASYAKQRPFSLGSEDQVHTAGSESIVFDYNGFRIAPLICYDLRFPELARNAVRQGADLLVYIASWPIKRTQHWVTLIQARAIENLAYVVGVNRTGSDPEFTYPGRTIVVDPHGVIIADAADREQVLTASLDSEVTASWRAQFPALKDAGW